MASHAPVFPIETSNCAAGVSDCGGALPYLMLEGQQQRHAAHSLADDSGGGLSCWW